MRLLYLKCVFFIVCVSVSAKLRNLPHQGCAQCDRDGAAAPRPDRPARHLRDHHLRDHRAGDVHGRNAQDLLHQRHRQPCSRRPKVGTCRRKKSWD